MRLSEAWTPLDEKELHDPAQSVLLPVTYALDSDGVQPRHSRMGLQQAQRVNTTDGTFKRIVEALIFSICTEGKQAHILHLSLCIQLSLDSHLT